jgi:3-oxoacyl-[acyl-carrier protein] reductase
MSDSYLNFANSAFGAKLTNMMGLPKPLLLARYRTDQPVLSGSLLLGAAPAAELLAPLAKAFAAMGVQTVAHHSLPQWVAIANQHGLTTGRWGVENQPGAKVKALVFDATGMKAASPGRSTSSSTMQRAQCWPVVGWWSSVVRQSPVLRRVRPPCSVRWKG